jgi:hypothetical protein
MRWSRKREAARPPTGYVGDHTDKLSRLRAMAHDEDERPSREDLQYGETIFNRTPVPLPPLLTGWKRSPRP